MPFNPFKRSQPSAAAAVPQSPGPNVVVGPIPAHSLHSLAATATATAPAPSSPLPSLPSSPASTGTSTGRSRSRSSSAFNQSSGGCSTPASSASSTFSPPTSYSQPHSRRHGRLESGGITFEAVTPVKRIGSVVRKPRSRQVRFHSIMRWR